MLSPSAAPLTLEGFANPNAVQLPHPHGAVHAPMEPDATTSAVTALTGPCASHVPDAAPTLGWVSAPSSVPNQLSPLPFSDRVSAEKQTDMPDGAAHHSLCGVDGRCMGVPPVPLLTDRPVIY